MAAITPSSCTSSAQAVSHRAAWSSCCIQQLLAVWYTTTAPPVHWCMLAGVCGSHNCQKRLLLPAEFTLLASVLLGLLPVLLLLLQWAVYVAAAPRRITSHSCCVQQRRHK